MRTFKIEPTLNSLSFLLAILLFMASFVLILQDALTAILALVTSILAVYYALIGLGYWFLPPKSYGVKKILSVVLFSLFLVPFVWFLFDFQGAINLLTQGLEMAMR